MKNSLFTLIAVVLLVVGGYFLFSNKDSDDRGIPQKGDAESMIVEEEKKEEKVEPYSYKLMDFSDENLAKSHETGRTVLFFNATWCSTCKSAMRDIKRNHADLPDDVTILGLDYDTEKELKQKYGVFTQHTFVQIDESGNEITKWVGGGVSTINTNIK
ncbi:thioredoxin family protein [candidate division WWE3 bacterium]|jgi:thiol-disulfide isomerase/thioredoxin|nr:thioredoxin family protein [candidate division WWE3 bacterium]MBT7349351.1 thioredoxin family protein [candidate division WWE3 bacterium]